MHRAVLSGVAVLLATLTCSVPLRSAGAAPNAAVAKLSGPMLAVARLATEQNLEDTIDEAVQNAEAGARLGRSWGPTHPAWPKARMVLVGRIDRLAESYGKSGLLEQGIQADITRLAGPGMDAFLAAVNGPAGNTIIGQDAMINFVSTVMADNPNSPRPGQPEWTQAFAALRKTFADEAGPSMPKSDGPHEAELNQYRTGPAGQVSMRFWSSVVGRTSSKITGAVNLMLFDDHDAIQHELGAAIAGAK